MFLIARLYNSACSYAVIPIRIHPIMMSIALHHYKLLKEKNYDFDIKETNNNSIILKREIEKWNNFASILRKSNRELFNEMLQSAYKYSNEINVKGEQFSTESLIMSILFEQYKIKNHWYNLTVIINI